MIIDLQTFWATIQLGFSLMVGFLAFVILGALIVYLVYSVYKWFKKIIKSADEPLDNEEIKKSVEIIKEEVLRDDDKI